MFCACELIQPFSAVFCMFKVVHKFGFRLVTNEIPNKRQPVKRRSCSDIDSCFWQHLYVLPRPSSRVLRTTQLLKVNCILLSSKHWLGKLASHARSCGYFEVTPPIALLGTFDLRLHCHVVVRSLTSSSWLFMFLLSRCKWTGFDFVIPAGENTGRLRITAC